MRGDSLKRTVRATLIVGGFMTLAVIASYSPPTAAASPKPHDEGTILFTTPEIRIYRTIHADGRSVVVLTNLDAEGHRMGGDLPEWETHPPIVRRDANRDTHESTAELRDGALEVHDSPGNSPTVQVIVNRGDGSSGPASPDEVRVEPGDHGTTIVINIDASPPAPIAPQPQSQPVVFVPTFLGVGGVPGPIRYPEHHHFLGYGHNVSSPGLFGGLGLNASNGYGINAPTCGRGFECMFGSKRDHP